MDTRHIMLFNLLLEFATLTFSFFLEGSCHLRVVISHHYCVEIALSSVDIMLCLEFNWAPQSWTHSCSLNVQYDAVTIIVDCKEGSVVLVLLTRVLPYTLDTIWAKLIYLWVICWRFRTYYILYLIFVSPEIVSILARSTKTTVTCLLSSMVVTSSWFVVPWVLPAQGSLVHWGLN